MKVRALGRVTRVLAALQSAPDEFGEFHVDELHDVELEAVAEVVNQVDAVGDLCPGQHG